MKIFASNISTRQAYHEEALSNQVDQTRNSDHVTWPLHWPFWGPEYKGECMNKVATMAEMEAIHGLSRMNPPLLKAGLAIAANECLIHLLITMMINA